MKQLLFAVLGAWSLTALSQEATAPEDVARRFVAAWNAHDAESLGTLIAADADWVTASGLRLRGRADIQQYLAKEHETWARRTNMRVVSVHVRPLAADSASVFMEWELMERKETGGASARRGNNLFVVTRSEAEWIIVAGQVARVPARQ
jgi:uncharacterized protein (TIGR02246 family)